MIPYLPYFFDELRKTAGVVSSLRRAGSVLTGGKAQRLEEQAGRLVESASKYTHGAEDIVRHGGRDESARLFQKAHRTLDLSKRQLGKASTERSKTTAARVALGGGALGAAGAAEHASHTSAKPNPVGEKTAGPLWEKTKIVGKGALAGAVGVGAGLGALEGAKHMGLKIPPKYVPYALSAIGAASAATYGVYKSMEAKELADVDQAEANRRSGAAIR